MPLFLETGDVTRCEKVPESKKEKNGWAERENVWGWNLVSFRLRRDCDDQRCNPIMKKYSRPDKNHATRNPHKTQWKCRQSCCFMPESKVAKP